MSDHDEPYELLALRYAHHQRPRRDNFLGGDPHDAAMPLDYFVWVARNASRTIVIDTGFSAATAAKRGRVIVRPVGDALRDVGVDPATVQDVIVTHMHYDHAGNVDLFPAARFHLQEREMQFATGRYMCFTNFRVVLEADDVVAMVRRLFNDQVIFHAGDAQIAPGIQVHLIGGHTPGLQAVSVATARGRVVLASDATHFYANMDEDRPFPLVTDLEAMLAGYRRLVVIADSIDHVVPGHDPLVMQQYPLVHSLNPLAVRLDQPPQFSGWKALKRA